MERAQGWSPRWKSLPSGQGKRTIPKLDQLTGRAQNCIGVAEMDYDTVMMQRSGTEPANDNSPLPLPRQLQVCRDPRPDSLALSASHLGVHEAVFIGIQLPFDEAAFDEGMSSSTAWAVRHRKSLRGQRRVPGQILTETTEELQPLQHPLRKSAVPHQHKLVDINVVMIVTIMICSRWQDSTMPTKLLQIHDLVGTTAATGVFKDHQEKEPPITIPKGEQLRLDAAAVVIDLLWSWRLFVVVWGTLYLCS